MAQNRAERVLHGRKSVYRIAAVNKDLGWEKLLVKQIKSVVNNCLRNKQMYHGLNVRLEDMPIERSKRRLIMQKCKLQIKQAI